MLRWGSWAAVLLCACDEPTAVTPGDEALLERRWDVRFVDDDATGQMDGSFLHPYDAIGLAVDDLDARGGGTVFVAEGVYKLDETIQADSAVSLIGAGSDQTFIVAGPEFQDWGFRTPLIQVGCTDWRDGICPPARPGGTLPEVLYGVTISGFTFKPGDPGRNALVVSRVQGFWFTHNVVEGPAYVHVFVVATTGVVSHNTFRHAVGAVGAHAGYRGVPGNIFVVDNTMEHMQVGGVGLFGSASGLAQWSDGLRAQVRRNVIRSSTGGGIRVASLISPNAWPGSEYGYGAIDAVLADNDFEDVPIPYVIDVGQPYRRESVLDWYDFDPQGYPEDCSDRWFTADLDLDIVGGTISNPTVALVVPVEISLSRHVGDGYREWQFAHYATFDVTGDPALFAGALINHPEYDPYQSPTDFPDPNQDWCKDQRQYDLVGGPRLHPDTPLTTTATTLDAPLHNTLRINGVVQPYSRVEENFVTCSGPPLDCVPSCGDGVDTDGDGLVDAADVLDCNPCTDLVDNDGNGLVDRDDPICASNFPCGEDCALACSQMVVPALAPSGIAPAGACLSGLYGPPLLCLTELILPQMCDDVPDTVDPITGLPGGGPNVQAYDWVLACAQLVCPPLPDGSVNIPCVQQNCILPPYDPFGRPGCLLTTCP